MTLRLLVCEYTAHITDPTVWSSQVRALRVATQIFASTTPPPPVPTAVSPSRPSILDLRRDFPSSTSSPDDNNRGCHCRSLRSTEHGRIPQQHLQLVQDLDRLRSTSQAGLGSFTTGLPVPHRGHSTCTTSPSQEQCLQDLYPPPAQAHGSGLL